MARASNPGLGSNKSLHIDVFVDDAITYLRFSGSIGEDFSGTELSESITTQTVVLQLADIRRISSFGIRGWIDFMQRLAGKTEDVVLVECAPKIVDQINMVANFTGIGQVFSLFAPYRCDYCDEDRKVILQLDRDWDVIKSMRPPDLPCQVCGEQQHFDEDPLTYFSYIVKQGPIELPQEVSALLTSPTKYRPSVTQLSRRLFVDKLVQGNFTHLYLEGDLDSKFPREKLADGLEGVVVIDLSDMGKLDPAGAAEWRTFLETIELSVDAVLITGMPSQFLEKLGNSSDLGSKAQLLSFSLPYECSNCGLAGKYLIQVEQQHQHLRVGSAPPMSCRECKKETTCGSPAFVLQRFPQLPKPIMSAPVRSFVESVEGRKPRRASTEAGVVATRRRRRSGAPVGLLAAAAAIAVIAAAIAAYLFFTKDKPEIVAEIGIGAPVAKSADKRPAWITSDTTLSGECQTDKFMKLTCVGVSSLDSLELEAAKQAREAALEEAVRTIGLMIDDEDWSAHVGSAYRRIRQTKVAEFLNEDLREPGSMRYQRSRDDLVTSKRAVVMALTNVYGDDIDVTEADAEYWERYAPPKQKNEQFLAFAQIQISGEIVERMVETFSKPVDALDARMVTAFPSLAWRYPEMRGGVAVIDIDDGIMKESGIEEGQIITAVQGRPVKDAPAFLQVLDYQLKTLAQESGDLDLTVLGDNGVAEVKIPATLFDAGGTIIE